MKIGCQEGRGGWIGSWSNLVWINNEKLEI